MSERPELPQMIAEIAAGNPYAMQGLYERYSAPLIRFCAFRLGDPEAAQDIVQDVFMQVWYGRCSFDFRGESALVAWLHTIANNAVIDLLRKRKRHKSVPLSGCSDAQVLGGPDMARVVCERLALWQAVTLLSRDQQQVVALRYVAGLTNAEAALVLSRSEGAVKLLHYRALRRLRSCLAAETAATEPGAALAVPA